MRLDASPHYRIAIMANHPRRLRLISRPFTHLVDAQAEAMRIGQSMWLSPADIVLQRKAYGDYWQEFLSEDDLDTFEGWLRYQGFDVATPDQLEMLRNHFDEMRERNLATPKMGRIDFKPLKPGECRYAVAIRKDSDLWLTLWVRRSPKGDVYVLVPRPNSDWNPHTSYHHKGDFHVKSFYDCKIDGRAQRNTTPQPWPIAATANSPTSPGKRSTDSSRRRACNRSRSRQAGLPGGPPQRGLRRKSDRTLTGVWTPQSGS